MSPTSTTVKTLTIDGVQVSAKEGETILEVARQNNIHIPTLCHLEGLSATGQCRLCMVEINGNSRLALACITTVNEGMVVVTQNKLIDKYRRMIVELLFSERNHICAVCVSNGHCELQSTAQQLGVTHITFLYLHPMFALDGSHPRFEVDHNRCILCSRCVRVCDEIEGAHTRDLRNRGSKSLIITDFDTPWGQSQTCTNCGKCVQVCPTGALAEKGKSVAEMSKRRQFLPYLVTRRGGNQT
ncbi:MAG TPA: bidirectional hydrogenase complex protein HoxU [Levilinea sp.]|nr:bidirectional hydrogenase complex protein HoxU [Levilinea sp.]